MVGGLQPPEEIDPVPEGQGLIFVLENAQLEVGQVGKSYQLLNCDDHAQYLMKHKKDPSLYRPDICHQALLMILDSPLNKAGKLKACYIRTHKNVLINVNTKVRIPRTFARFSGLMVQLLQKLSIRASNGPDKLLQVVKGPVTKYLPVTCTRVGFSWASKKLVKIEEYIKQLDDEKTAVFVVGAFAHGKVDATWVDEELSISQYPLSAANCISRITGGFEMKWEIV